MERALKSARKGVFTDAQRRKHLVILPICSFLRVRKGSLQCRQCRLQPTDKRLPSRVENALEVSSLVLNKPPTLAGLEPVVKASKVSRLLKPVFKGAIWKIDVLKYSQMLQSDFISTCDTRHLAMHLQNNDSYNKMLHYKLGVTCLWFVSWWRRLSKTFQTTMITHEDLDTEFKFEFESCAILEKLVGMRWSFFYIQYMIYSLLYYSSFTAT